MLQRPTTERSFHVTDIPEHTMMGENEPSLSIEEALLKKIDKKSKEAKSSSNAEGDDKEKEKATSVEQEQQAIPENDDTSLQPSSPSRNSPDPNCAICLEQLQNKSFTDSCFHMFCFTCLVEWSKVKAECPLCKQRFKSIVHNVRSARDYDQYHIQPKRGDNVWNMLYDQRFRYRTTLTSERINERSNNEWVNGRNRNNLEYTYHQEIASHRLRYAPHSVHLFANSHAASRVPCSFRQRIYEQDVWVIPAARGRVRLATPQFYQQNPACTHRLIPWLNRELVALLHNGESHVTFVMELIMALINRYEITGREFFLHVEPYLAHHTSHFIHEFYNFAISPYDMEAYDNHAVYQNITCPTFDNTISPPDNDVILISLGNSRSRQNQSASTSTSFHRSSKANLRSYRIKKRAYKKLKKLVLKRNSKNNLWESALHSVSSSLPSGNGSDCVFSAPGPSASHSFSALLEVAAAAADAAELADRAESMTGKDDDCIIVEEVKPKHERTPEIVVLSSDDEQSNRVKKDFLVNFEPAASFSPRSEEPISVTLESDSSDIECVYETPIIKETNVEIQNDQPSTSQVRESPVPSTSRDHNNNSTHASPSHYPSTLFNPWSTENENDTFSFPKSSNFVTRHDNPSSSQYASTESYSDSEHPSDRNSSEHKKLKLRSVIAHFSIDRESDSSRHRDSGHHSSHKRHKEKKKKKKKHSHKHKHRIYSDSD